ncbi:hypothetical protein GQ53DRAFT_133334 [Thozetella sp. PMI_491]|nr:hypothetical protein GQ53DRAFT_133334 [Thozetella sp. PMI_491]
MAQQFSTSKVTVEYFDPHDVYKLLAPGLVPRLPLRDLHWQSHAGPLRSINTLHVDLVPTGTDFSAILSPLASPNPLPQDLTRTESNSRDDGFQSVQVGARAPAEPVEPMGNTLKPPAAPGAGGARRHQIPGLRRTPYLKVLLVRCDDNDTYKATTRAEIREWIKAYASPSQRKSISTAENHDAFEWLIVHVVLPNTAAATQPRITGKGSETQDTKSSSRWRGSSSSLLEKLRSDFNSTSKNAVDRIVQIRIGINDVPYDLLPRVVPAVPTGYHETEQDAENAWTELIARFKSLILSSFDMRVTHYEDDIKEKDAQRSLPGWNFCTFFILKEGLARGFESVGLVEDALVGYDELSVGLDTVLQEQAITGAAEAHGGALLAYTEELRDIAKKAVDAVARRNMEFDEEAVDLQSRAETKNPVDDISISSTKKPYRELILANNVSVFDFRCYIFARQISLLLRLGNAWSTREELLAKLKEQQESVLHGVAPRAPPPKQTVEGENLTMLAEICRRTLEFIPAVSGVMRKDVVAALLEEKTKAGQTSPALDVTALEVVDNVVASFTFSVAQQILAQTSTKALPIPPSTLAPLDVHEPKTSIPEPKTMMHPARSSSLHIRPGARPPPSPGVFPGPGRRASVPETDAAQAQFLKVGLEELAARRAELYTVSRNILEGSGKKRGWSDGWGSVPALGEADICEMEEISLDDDDAAEATGAERKIAPAAPVLTGEVATAGIENDLLRAALDNAEDFYRLYETLTDKALRHYTVANHDHSVQANMADLAVFKFHLQDYGAAASYFYRITPFFGENGWSLLELAMLIMYCKSLKELKRKDEYVGRLLKLLSKAASAQHDRIQQQISSRSGRALGAGEPDTSEKKVFPEESAVAGYLQEMLETAASLEKEVKVPLGNFFCDVETNNIPEYDAGRDSFSTTLSLRSLLADSFEAKSVRLQITSLAGGANKEIWMQAEGAVTFMPGKNKVTLRSSTIMEGTYDVTQVVVACNNITMYHERGAGQPIDKASTLLRHPKLSLYRRASSLDVQLAAAKEVRLDKNNSLELEVMTGWNAIKSLEVKIKSATGGLRLLTSEAKAIGEFAPEKAEGGTFSYSAIPAEAGVKIRFPFTTEQDVMSVAVKVEVTYSTEAGSFAFHTTPSVPIALALGVNVQDVFKHDALFSRFTVSTASPSPLRLFKSELLASKLFEPHFGRAPSGALTVFPKQPASLLYRITRKAAAEAGPGQKMMYLKLHYSVLLDEIEELLKDSLNQALKESEFWEFSRLVVSRVIAQARDSLSPYDLERVALLGDLSTSFVTDDIQWEKQLKGLGADAAAKLQAFITSWQKGHRRLTVPVPDDSDADQQCSILIPVDVPAITVVHTANIRLEEPAPEDSLSALTEAGEAGSSVVCINQLLPAALHLKWSRIWDVADASGGSASEAADKVSPYMKEDLEFSYEVTAPVDTWLIAGRRKGHFVIPAVEDVASMEELSSGPDTEADIPLMLIPLREGWLPYPSVEVREVKRASGGGGGETPDLSAEGPQAQTGAAGGGIGHCETDYRNLGETVHVISDRTRVTLSLDASGPGGGPLVLESERLQLGGRVVA